MDWRKRYQFQASWTEAIRRSLLGQINMQPSARILEVGCGPGVILTGDLPVAPEFRHGIDLDFQALQQAHASLPASRWICGDGLRLPFADYSFSVSFCHYFLLWVNPLAALAEMRRVTQPGGWVFAFAEPDYQARIDYPALLANLGKLQTQALVDQGIDPGIGRRLGELFAQSQIRVAATGMLGSMWTLPVESASFENEWEILSSDLQENLTRQELDDLKHIDRQSREDGSRVLLVPTFFAAGQV